MIWIILSIPLSLLLGVLSTRSIVKNRDQVLSFKMIDMIVLTGAVVVFVTATVLTIRGES